MCDRSILLEPEIFFFLFIFPLVSWRYWVIRRLKSKFNLKLKYSLINSTVFHGIGNFETSKLKTAKKTKPKNVPGESVEAIPHRYVDSFSEYSVLLFSIGDNLRIPATAWCSFSKFIYFTYLSSKLSYLFKKTSLSRINLSQHWTGIWHQKLINRCNAS